MGDALGSSVSIAAYLALFGGVGFAFVFVNLLIGKFFRPANPHPEKLEIYECGEPTIGTSFVQFDLRFYVVALVFIIFDVEVAFLFPWGAVFGKALSLANASVPIVQTTGDQAGTLSAGATGLLLELGVRNPQIPADVSAASAQQAIEQFGRQVMRISVWTVSFFFAVLLIGLAYEWRSGALDWVRAVTHSRAPSVVRREVEPDRRAQESVLSV